MLADITRLELTLRRRSTIGYAAGMALYTLAVVALYRPFCNPFTPRRWTAASCSKQLGALKTSADPCSCRGRGTAPVARLGHMPVQVAVGGIAIRAEPFRPTATTGVPAIQPGATPIVPPPEPNSLSRRGVNRCGRGALLPMPRHRAISDAAPGTTCGNHRANLPRHPRASPGMVCAVQMHEPTRKAGRNPHGIPPYKRGVRRFKSYCAHQVFAAK
jgi:hypothetical protein